MIEARDHGASAIEAIHDPGYLTFLQTVWARRDELSGIEDEILTGHFARPQMHRRPSGLLALLGYHLADTSTAIRAGTWEAVYASAQVAVEAAEIALRTGRAYALCRPPGHHAYRECAGGFCYLNNTAIAAEHIRRTTGGRVAILDIDVHHGNGTQGMFYDRSDVVTVSIHADPANYFPFYAGYADEAGTGAGAGFNRNLPLPIGTGDGPWRDAIEAGLAFVVAQNPDALVVALGLDASAEDPIGAFKVTSAGFADAARTIAAAGVPTLIVQEGGYLCKALARNLTAFLAEFDSGERPPASRALRASVRRTA